MPTLLESWNSLVGKDLKDHIVPTPSPQAGTPSTRPGSSGPYPAWLCTLPGVGETLLFFLNTVLPHTDIWLPSVLLQFLGSHILMFSGQTANLMTDTTHFHLLSRRGKRGKKSWQVLFRLCQPEDEEGFFFAD